MTSLYLLQDAVGLSTVSFDGSAHLTPSSSRTCASLLTRVAAPAPAQTLPALLQLSGTTPPLIDLSSAPQFFTLRSASNPTMRLCPEFAASATEAATTRFTAAMSATATPLLLCVPEWTSPDLAGVVLVLLDEADLWPKVLCLATGKPQRAYVLPMPCTNASCPLTWQDCNGVTGYCADADSAAPLAKGQAATVVTASTPVQAAPNCVQRRFAVLVKAGFTVAECKQDALAAQQEAAEQDKLVEAAEARLWHTVLFATCAVAVAVALTIMAYPVLLYWSRRFDTRSRAPRGAAASKLAVTHKG